MKGFVFGLHSLPGHLQADLEGKRVLCFVWWDFKTHELFSLEKLNRDLFPLIFHLRIISLSKLAHEPTFTRSWEECLLAQWTLYKSSRLCSSSWETWCLHSRGLTHACRFLSQDSGRAAKNVSISGALVAVSDSCVCQRVWCSLCIRLHIYTCSLLPVLYWWLCGGSAVPVRCRCVCERLRQWAVDATARCCHLWTHSAGAAPHSGVSLHLSQFHYLEGTSLADLVWW